MSDIQRRKNENQQTNDTRNWSGSSEVRGQPITTPAASAFPSFEIIPFSLDNEIEFTIGSWRACAWLSH